MYGDYAVAPSTDTTMALSGINKTLLAQFGGEVRCYISDPRVVRRAKADGITRSMAAVDLALGEEEKIFVFGNAPTALFRLLEHKAQVSGVVGVPVVLWARKSRRSWWQVVYRRLPPVVAKGAATSPPPLSCLALQPAGGAMAGRLRRPGGTTVKRYAKATPPAPAPRRRQSRRADGLRQHIIPVSMSRLPASRCVSTWNLRILKASRRWPLSAKDGGDDVDATHGMLILPA